MIEIIIIIPIADNEGQPFKAEYPEFEALALNSFGGVTLLPGSLAGKWLDDGTVYEDSSVAYLVAIRSITEGGRVGELAESAKRIFRQKAVYLRYLGRSEII